jgi:hypothetical protein
MIVAYNNRTYEGYRFVFPETYTFFGANYWINQHGDRTRYIYDLYDVVLRKMVTNYQPMIDEFNYVKNIILKTTAAHSIPLRVYIFNFKHKWEKRFGKNAVGIYFSDLMAIYKTQMEQTGIEYFDQDFSDVWTEENLLTKI